MRKILLIALLFASLLSCKKDKDPGLSSPEGSWTYTTPDGKIGVTFDVVVASSGFDVQNQAIRVNGVDGKAEKTVTAFTSTGFQKIRINANDSKLVSPYDINFNNGVVSGDFKTITVPTATYSYPYGTTNNLSSITITRK